MRLTSLCTGELIELLGAAAERVLVARVVALKTNHVEFLVFGVRWRLG